MLLVCIQAVGHSLESSRNPDILPLDREGSEWLLCSSFADIFDVVHFLQSVSHDVLMITELPHGFEWATREYYATGIRATRIKNAPVQASPEWYIENVLPIMKRLAVALLVDLCVLNVPILCDWYFLVTSYISESQCVWADICHCLKSLCLNAPGQLARYSLQMNERTIFRAWAHWNGPLPFIPQTGLSVLS